MALTYTPAAEVGARCPDFNLMGTDNTFHALREFSDARVLVVMFICNHCPYVKAVEDRLIALAKDLGGKGAAFVAISSNDPTDYPDDSFANMQKRWQDKRYPFVYLFDESQEVAKKFGAVCTPDFFVYDEKRTLRYRGRLDDNWQEPNKVRNEDLKDAILNLLSGQPLAGMQKPSMGCSIKWRGAED